MPAYGPQRWGRCLRLMHAWPSCTHQCDMLAVGFKLMLVAALDRLQRCRCALWLCACTAAAGAGAAQATKQLPWFRARSRLACLNFDGAGAGGGIRMHGYPAASAPIHWHVNKQ